MYVPPVKLERHRVDTWLMKDGYHAIVQQNKRDHPRMTILDKRSTIEKFQEFGTQNLMNLLYSNQTIWSLVFSHMLAYTYGYTLIQGKSDLKYEIFAKKSRFTKDFKVLDKNLQLIYRINATILIDNQYVQFFFVI